METGLVVAFWIVSFSLVLTPGADWAFAISSGLRGGPLLPAITGLLSGYLVITIIVAAGVGALVANFPVVLSILTWAGAAYLLWLGYSVLRDPPVPQTGQDDAGEGGLRIWLRGVAISGLNPKALLLFMALLPQFTSRDTSWPIWGQIALMGMIQILNCGVVYSLVGLCSRIVLNSRPAAAKRVSQFSGMSMMVIATLLIAEQILPFK